MYIDNTFSKSFSNTFSAASYFINSILEESKYWSDAMKKHLNKELVVTKKDGEDFENST